MRGALITSAVALACACSGAPKPTAPSCDASPELQRVRQLAADGYLYRAFDAATAAHERCPGSETRAALDAATAELTPAAAPTTLAPADRERALELYRDGANRRLDGDHTGAILQLERSLAIWPHPLTMVQIGLTHEAVGNAIDARKAYARALAAAETLAAEPVEPRIVRGHASRITAIAYSDDGSTVASAAYGELKLWDAIGGKQIASYDVLRQGTIESMAFLPGGDRLAVVRSEYEPRAAALEIWSVPDGDVIASYDAPGERAWCVVTAGDRIAYSIDGDVFVRTVDGELILSTSESRPVWYVALSADGRRVAWSTETGRIAVYDLDAGRQEATLSIDRGVYGIAFAPDESQLLAAGINTAYLLDIATGAELATRDRGPGSMVRTVFAPRARVAANVLNRRIDLFDVPSLTLRRSIDVSQALAAAVSPDEARIAVSSSSALRIYDVATGELIHTLGASDQLQWVSVTARRFVVAGLRLIAAWDADRTPPVHVIPVAANTTVAFGADPDFFALGLLDVSIVDFDTLHVQRTFEDSAHTPLSVAYSADGRRVAAGDGKGWVRVWNAADGALVAAIDTRSGWVMDVALSPDGRTVAAAGDVVAVYDVESAERIDEQDWWYASVTYTPDGRLLVDENEIAVSADGSMVARVQTSGEVVVTRNGINAYQLRGHHGLVNDIQFGPDGRYVVTVAADATIRLWSVEDGAPLAVLVSDDPDAWLVVAHDRRVDGSERGRELLYWQAGNIRLPWFVGWQRHHTPELLGSVMP